MNLDESDILGESNLDDLADAVEAHGPTPTMFCLSCRYPLNGLETFQCPECGRTFDPNSTITFTRDPKRHRLRRALIGAGWVILVLLLGVTGYGTVKGSFSMLAVFFVLMWTCLIFGMVTNLRVKIRRRGGKRVIEGMVGHSRKF